MKIAAKIEPCPIVEAIMEVRFETIFDEGAVFGLIYNHLRKEYSKITNLPILEIPSSIRKIDPQLIYLPYYRIESTNDKNKLIQIGPKTFSIIVKGLYPGWISFKKDILHGLEKLQDSEVVSEISRFSLRYLNFFDFDIVSRSNLSILLNNAPFDATNSLMRFEVKDKDTTTILTIGSSVELKDERGVKKGSTIDIDTLYTSTVKDFFTEKEKLLELCHNTEKKIFFNLLSDEYGSTLKVTYD